MCSTKARVLWNTAVSWMTATIGAAGWTVGRWTTTTVVKSCWGAGVGAGWPGRPSLGTVGTNEGKRVGGGVGNGGNVGGVGAGVVVRRVV